MNGNSRLAMLAGAAAIVVLVTGGLIYLGGSQAPSIGAPSTPSPSATRPSVPTDAAGRLPTAPLSLAIVDIGGTVRRELRLPSDAWMADLSADGNQIVFTSASSDLGFCGGCGQTRRVAIVAADGSRSQYAYPSDASGQPNPATVAQPAWSPDGSALAFQADDGNGNLDIYVSVLDRTDARGVTGDAVRLTTDPGVDELPAWSPDGSTIFYTNGGATPLDDSGFSPTQEIWSVPAASGPPKRLTSNDTSDTMPDVATDGRVAYWSQGDIMVMDPDGTDANVLVRQAREPYFNPRWSPDDSKLALLRYDPSRRATLPSGLGLPTDLPLLDVVVVDLVTGQVTDVGQQVVSDWNPVSWTPDGTGLLIDRHLVGQ